MIAVLNAMSFEYTLIDDTPENRALMESLYAETQGEGPYVKHEQFDEILEQGENVGDQNIVECVATFTYSPEF